MLKLLDPFARDADWLEVQEQVNELLREIPLLADFDAILRPQTAEDREALATAAAVDDDETEAVWVYEFDAAAKTLTIAIPANETPVMESGSGEVPTAQTIVEAINEHARHGKPPRRQ